MSTAQRVREPTRRPITRAEERRRADRVQLVERVRYVNNRTSGLRNGSLVMSIVAIIAMLVVVICFMTDVHQVSFYRAGLLSLHGIFAVLVFSTYVDQERIDFSFSLVAGFFALFADLLVAIVGTIRLVNCGHETPGSDVDLFICSNEPTASLIVPIVAWILFLLAAVQIVVLFVWLGRRINYLSSLANRVLFNRRDAERRRREAGPLQRDIQTSGGTPYAGLTRDAALYDESERSVRVNRRPTEITAGSAALRYMNMVLGVLLALIVLFIVIVNGIYLNEVSFYRAALLIVPAHLAGALLAYFGTLRIAWRGVLIFFALASCVSAIWAVVCEMARYVRCVSDSAAPEGQIEQLICDEESWRGAVWPITSIIVALISVVALIGALYSFCSPQGRRVRRSVVM